MIQAKLEGTQRERERKRNVEVDCPKIVQEYNQHMGRSDRQDQNVNKHRIAIRGKKWY